MKGKVSEEIGLKGGWSLVRGFIHLEIWRKRFQKSWSERGLVSGQRFHSLGNMKGKVSEEIGLKGGWSLVRGFIHLEIWRERFQKAGLKRVVELCKFPSVSGHRPIKIPEDWLFQTQSGPWSDWGTVLVVSCPIVFTMPRTSWLLFATKFKPQVSAKHWHAYKFIQTAGTPCFGWSKRCTVKAHHIFVGCKAEPKVTS